MKFTLVLILNLWLGVAGLPPVAGEMRVTHRVTGLFQPDRADDFRHQAETIRYHDGDRSADLKLVEDDYDNARATFA